MFKSRLMDIEELIQRGQVKPTLGRTFYVMKDASADTYRAEFVKERGTYLDGVEKVYGTVQAALTAAGNYDAIYVGPGFYTEGAVLNITQRGLRLLGPGKDNLAFTGLKNSSSSHHIITVNENDVEIAGLAFFQAESAYDAIRVNTTVAAFKCHIHDCKFDLGGAGEYGIYLGGTQDAPDCLVENCLFRSFATAGIRTNGTRVVIKNNLFLVPASTSGIEYIPTAGNRPDGQLLDNRFQTTDGINAIGIEVVNTPTAGMLFIDGNHFSQKFNGEAKAITKRNGGYLGLNYRGNGAITAT